MKLPDRKYQIISTDWGYCAALWTERGLYQLSFPVAQQADLTPIIDGLNVKDDGESEQLNKELKAYFKGFAVSFEVAIDWQGYTPFQRQALEAATEIAYGSTQSYSQVAERIGRPQAVRAVGGAMHINRVPIIVPCHRVVGKTGSLVGYGGGLDFKQALLLLETGTLFAEGIVNGPSDRI